MTNFLGQDGRLNFPDQSDDQLRARRAELLKEGNAFVAKERKSGADIERAGRIVNHAHAIDAELKSRAERRAAGDSGDARRINHDEGALGAGLGAAGKTYLTSAGMKAAGAELAAKIGAPQGGGLKALTVSNGTAVAITAPGLAPLGRPATVLDKIPVIAASAPSFRFLQQTSRSNNAAVVAKGATKPESVYGISTVDRTLQVVAHVSEPVFEYDLQDIPNLTSFIQAEMEFGLGFAVESALFNDTGAAGELHGLAGTSGVQAQEFGVDLLTTTRRALTKIENLGYTGSVFVVSPSALEEIDLATTSGSGEFQNARAPFDRAESRLWGVPTVVSTQLPAETAYLIGADAVALYSDPGARIRVEWDKSNDDFVKNFIRCRLEGRFEIAATRPEAIVKIATVSGE